MEFKDFLGRFRQKETSDDETLAQAHEAFCLLSAAGAGGQEPMASYGAGTTLILSELRSGTILREKYEDNDLSEPVYIWYFVGRTQKNNESVETVLCDSTPFTGNPPGHYFHTSPIYQLLGPDKMTLSKRVLKRNKTGIEYEVGKPGILLDESLATWMNKESCEAIRRTRQTLQIDIIVFGKKVKEKEEKPQTQGLQELRPVYEPGGV
ncbi:hypothetical protein M1403_02490 [Patescibacteria group bacterium]|nr:hypothetical protein [Patescibacteria group bacterium]